MKNSLRTFLFIFGIFFLSCAEKEDPYIWKPMEVTVTAYNSVPEQTDSEPFIGAWGDTLSYREKSIAVSRDLLDLGLKRNTKVMIEGLPGIYIVKDKMASRWKRKIDIYMGEKVEKAKKWGIKELGIVYAVKRDSSQTDKQN